MVVRLSAVRLYKSVTIRKIRNIVKSNRKKIELDTTCPEITHGALIKDRKSAFQGHAATARSIEDVAAVVTKLMQNKKIHDATHNILAYRIERFGGIQLGPDRFRHINDAAKQAIEKAGLLQKLR